MATPKRERTPLPPSTTFAAAANRYIAEGGSERSLVAVMDHFGPKTTIGEIDEAAIAKAVRDDWAAHDRKHGPDRHHQTDYDSPQPRLRHRAPAGPGQGSTPAGSRPTRRNS